MKAILNWKVFLILWVSSTLGVIAVLPYAVSFQAAILENVQLPFPLPVLLAISVLQTAVLLATAIFAGMFFARRTGLELPILEAATRGEPVGSRIRAILPLSIVLGIAGTLVLLGLEFFVFQPALVRQLGDAAIGLDLRIGQPAPWKGFLASFYGGIDEEILLRLFMMSFFAWLGHFVSKTSDGKPSAGVIWSANILAAVLFGLGHLPAVSTVAPITPLVIARTVALNATLGIVLGWLYWKRGLEAAMIAHFSGDLVLHVLLAL